MKYILAVFSLFMALRGIGQTDRNGNPVFNSIPMSEDSLNGFKLLGNYYPLRNNIDNKTTSVYVADSPTLKEIAQAATRLPADFFILEKNGSVVSMILVNYYPSKQFLVLTPGNPSPKRYKFPLKGEIAENRADEIVKAGYDPVGAIRDGKLDFNGKHFVIVPNEAMKSAVIDLIRTEHFDTAEPTGMRILSKGALHAKILAETKEGGKLDFFSPIKGKEMEAVQFKPGLIVTRIEFALYMWGRANFELGVGTLDEAFGIFAEFRGRELNIRERESIKDGFEKRLER
jgi:hypothetical protein